MVGLAYIAKKNGSDNVDDYITKISESLDNQGLINIQQDIYNAGNERFHVLSDLHPRTRSAILYLLQLDKWIPDGSGSTPKDFDSSIADDRIANLNTVISK